MFVPEQGEVNGKEKIEQRKEKRKVVNRKRQK
jgi:hypothetical protein